MTTHIKDDFGNDWYFEDAQHHVADETSITTGDPCRDALQAVITWADFALKNKDEFDSHGVAVLTGPTFDAARLVLDATASAIPSPETNVLGAGDRIAEAIEACDWSGASIGNKEILRAAVTELRSLQAWQRGAISCREAEEARIDEYRRLAIANPTPSQPNGKGWQPIKTAPLDKTALIIAVPTKDRDDHIVGEAYFDPDCFEGGDWWWAGTANGDYASSPISDCNHHSPEFWQPMPAAPSTEGATDV